MFTRTFNPQQFLRFVYGTEPFLEYCRSRGIAFEQVVGMLLTDGDYRRWQMALQKLPEAEQARIELELAQVNEMAHADVLAVLAEAARGRNLPPESLPGETAAALWFFLHHGDLFREVFLQQEVAELNAWRTAKAPRGIVLDNLPRRQVALTRTLREFFRIREGTGRFCAVDAFRIGKAVCFVAYLSDRLHLFDVFTEAGEHTTHAARPAFSVLFVYYTDDGRVLLKAKQRAADKILDLFRRFGKAVLGVNLDEGSLAPAFHLGLFKRRFDPLPDAEDMEEVRVRALHLVYPERAGRRQIKLETLAGDSQFAILELLREHGGSEHVLNQLTVLSAELQVTLRVDGRSKHYSIRLWPDRCSLNQTALGERLYTCLKRWGITHAE